MVNSSGRYRGKTGGLLPGWRSCPGDLHLKNSDLRALKESSGTRLQYFTVAEVL